ncbi:MAG: NAD(P)/FAD-dependent oxidoreductase [Anaerolineae bacterium]|jgi:thioredoxin reductase (NADPH)
MTEQDVLDITIIGGGPSGLFAAFYAGMRDARTKIIDSLPQLGGQLMALYPDKYIYDIPGFPKVLAREFVERQVDQAMDFGPEVCLDEKVTQLARRSDGLIELRTEPGNVHLSHTVIIAAGVGAFVPRTLDIPDVQEMEGKGVYYFVRDLDAFQGQRVLIVGGGDTALDWAKSLLGVASSVILIHRRGKFRAHEQSVKEILMSSANVLRFYELKALHGDERVRGATVFDNRSDEEITFEVDAVVLGLGFLANLGPIKEWGLDIVRNSIQVDSTMQTNLQGVYAVGDITTYDGKIKLIATATAEAAIAANYAKNYIDPKSKIAPGHSSDRDK